MEGLVFLGIVALSIGLPLLLGWWGRRSKIPRVLLALLLPIAAFLAWRQFREADELESFLNQKITYSLATSKVGSNSLSILPLKGPVYEGVLVRALRKGSEAGALREYLQRMNWKDAVPSVPLFPKGREAEEGVVILDQLHDSSAPTLIYEVSADLLPGLAGLELQVEPNGCSRMDLSLGRVIRFWLGIFASAFAVLAAAFLLAWVFRKAPR